MVQPFKSKLLSPIKIPEPERKYFKEQPSSFIQNTLGTAPGIKYIKNGGKLIFHLPMLHIVDKDNYKTYLKTDFKSLAYQI